MYHHENFDGFFGWMDYIYINLLLISAPMFHLYSEVLSSEYYIRAREIIFQINNKSDSVADIDISQHNWLGKPNRRGSEKASKVSGLMIVLTILSLILDRAEANNDSYFTQANVSITTNINTNIHMNNSKLTLFEYSADNEEVQGLLGKMRDSLKQNLIRIADGTKSKFNLTVMDDGLSLKAEGEVKHDLGTNRIKDPFKTETIGTEKPKSDPKKEKSLKDNEHINKSKNVTNKMQDNPTTMKTTIKDSHFLQNDSHIKVKEGAKSKGGLPIPSDSQGGQKDMIQTEAFNNDVSNSRFPDGGKDDTVESNYETSNVQVYSVDCDTTVRDSMNDFYYSVKSFADKEIPPKVNTPRSSSSLIIEDVTEIALIRICMADPHLFSSYLKRSAMLATYVLSSVAEDNYDLKPKTVRARLYNLVNDEFIDQIPSLVSSISREVDRVVDEMERGVISGKSKVRSRRHISRRLLSRVSLDEFNVDGDDEELEQLKKSLKESRRSKIPLERSRSVSAVKVEMVTSSVGLADSSINLTDNIKYLEFSTHSKPTLSASYSSSGPGKDGGLDFHRFNKQMSLMKDCIGDLPFEIDMLKVQCSNAVVIMMMIGNDFCKKLLTCPTGQSFVSGSCKATSCDTIYISTNFFIRDLDVKSETHLRMDGRNVIGIPKIQNKVICSINFKDLPSTNTLCAAKSLAEKKTIFTRLPILLFPNNTMKIGKDPNSAIIPKIYRNRMSSYTCTPDHCENCLSVTTCSGDDDYCKILKGGKCASDSDCFCTLDEGLDSACYQPDIHERIDTSCSELSAVVEIWASVEIIDNTPIETAKAVPHCKTSTSCNAGKISIDSDCYFKAVIVEINNVKIWQDASSSLGTKFMSVAIPWDLVINPENYKVRIVLPNNNQDPEIEFGSCQPFRVCEQIGRMRNRSWYMVSECWPLSVKIIIFYIIPGIIMILIILSVIGFCRSNKMKTCGDFFSSLIFAACCPVAFIWLFIRYAFGKVKKKTIKAHSKVSEYRKIMSDDLESNIVREDEQHLVRNTKPNETKVDLGVGKNKPRVYRSNNSGYIPSHLSMFNLITIICVTFPSGYKTSESCTQTEIYDMKSSVCEEISGHYSCTVEDSIQFKIMGENQTICFLMEEGSKDSVDSSNFKNMIGKVVVKVQTIRLKCNEVFLYHVFDPEINLRQQSNCYSIGECKSGPDIDCRDFKNPNNLKLSRMFPSSIGKMKKIECYASSGCWAENCFTCSDGCVFASIEIMNRGGATYRVTKCSSWANEIKGEISYETRGVKIIKPFILSAVNPFTSKDFSLEINDFAYDHNQLSRLCFLTHKGTASYQDCQSETSVSKGIIGEIRCPTEAEAQNPGKGCFFNDDVISTQKIDWTATAELRSLNISYLHLKNKLPTIMSNALLQYEDGDIHARIENEVVLDATLKMKGFKLVSEIQKTSCLIEEGIITGCYDCTKGAKLKLKLGRIKSDTAGDSFNKTVKISVNCESCNLKNVFYRDLSSDKLEVIAHTKCHQIIESCDYECGNKKGKFNILGELSEVINIDPRVKSGLIIGKDQSDTDMSGYKLLSFLGPYRNILIGLAVFMSVITIIILGLTLRYICSFIPMAKQHYA